MNSNDVEIFNQVRAEILSKFGNLENMYGEYASRLNNDEQKKIKDEINRITSSIRSEKINYSNYRKFNVVDIQSLHASKLYHHFNSKTVKIDDLADEDKNYGEIRSLTPAEKINKSGSFLQNDNYTSSFMAKYYDQKSQVDHVISSSEVENIKQLYINNSDLLSFKKKIYALQNFFSLTKKRNEFRMSNKIEKVLALDSIFGTKYINNNDLNIFQFEKSRRRKLENIINDRFIALKELAK
jgi:hypothetical protein